MTIFRSLLLAFSLALLSLAAGAEPVDINTASAAEIAQALKGIGMKKAEAIVADRELNGPFKDPMDLTRVDGVGKKLVENNLADILVSGN